MSALVLAPSNCTFLNAPIEEYGSYGLKHNLTTVENTYKTMKFFHNDPKLRENLGMQGLDHVRKTFGYNEFKNKWLEVTSESSVQIALPYL